MTTLNVLAEAAKIVEYDEGKQIFFWNVFLMRESSFQIIWAHGKERNARGNVVVKFRIAQN